MRIVTHPGPVRESRIDLAACGGAQIEVPLAAGCTLDRAVAQALEPLGCDSAYLEVIYARVEALSYVIPAHSPDGRHVAWYSETFRFEGGTIDRLGMIVGQHESEVFLHGHGLWTGPDQLQAMGHILPHETILAAPVRARGIALSGARFDRRYDAETNFDLFKVDQTGEPGPDYAAARLLPNQDFATALDDACATLGWTAARVFGVGSVNTARFEDGRVLDSHATEFVITDAIAGQKGPGPKIAIVGLDGSTILTGRLARGENAVLVTAEVVLHRTPSTMTLTGGNL